MSMTQVYDENSRRLTKTWPAQYDEWFEEQNDEWVQVRWFLLALEQTNNDRGEKVVREVWTWTNIGPGQIVVNNAH